MKSTTRTKRNPEMRDHYDFSGGERGKYAQRYAEGTNVVLLSPDIAPYFPDSEAVNSALRSLVKIATAKNAKRTTRR